MLFLNPWLLAGLAGVAIPIVIHLVRRQAAKPIDWGAMRFLVDTVVVRRRKMEWEDLLLMAARCLLLALAALALARPLAPPGASGVWLLLSAALLGVALLAASFVLSGAGWRWSLRGAGLVLLLGAGWLGWLERQDALNLFEAGGRRDVALVIDASDSMLRRDAGGRTMFERAVEEARELVMEAPRGTAFTVVLGGPAPEAVTAAPLSHRADVLGVLEELQAVGGTFRAHEALGMATLALSEGLNVSKEIVVFSDGQRHGWRLGNPAAWDGLEEAWEAMPSRPKLLLRTLEGPPAFRNVALEGFELTRSVVGTDREVGVRVTVGNTGDEAVTSGPVSLEVGGRVVGEEPVGLLVAGQSETVEFRVRFREPGPVVVRARIPASDDLAADNRLERVVAVRDSLRVLIVDGHPSGGFFERASGYTALALAPGAIDGATDGYLMDPEVVPAGQLRAGDLSGRDVVVLADVARLPRDLAETLAGRVAAGCGLVVIAGPRAEASFYNAWRGMAGPVVPMPIGGEEVEVDGMSLAASTFVHESLALFKEAGDLGDARVVRWRKLGDPVEGAAQGAAFANGDAFLASRVYGKGRSLVVGCSLDARSGNLPAKRAFVPLVHELVTWAAGRGPALNVASGWSPSVILGEGGGGLSASYHRGHEDRRPPVLERVDPAIDFNWQDGRPGRGVPADGFRAVWRGRLVAPVSGTYRFVAEVDDAFELRIGEHPAMHCELGRHELGRLSLEAGTPLPVEARYREDGGEALVRLLWTPPGGVEEVVPPRAFLPRGGGEGRSFPVIDPRGLARDARVATGRRGEELSIGGSAVPGVYEVQVGEDGAEWFDGWAGGVLPVVVARDDDESRLVPMNDPDRELIGSRIELLRPRSVADIVGVLEGRGFGREIWKWMAVAAAALFLLESVLARWVSKSRRMAEEVRVEFGDHPAWEGGRR